MNEQVTDPVSAQETKRDRDATKWNRLIEDATAYFRVYNDKADSVDKVYSDLEKLSAEKVDREFQIFWANLEVQKPSIYSRPPVPVVAPRFKNRDPMANLAAEVLERALSYTVECDDFNGTMISTRDDVAVNARGATWVRLTEEKGSKKVVTDHLERRDFLHGPARKWKEVPWVARRAWLDEKKGVERFGEVFRDATFKKRIKGVSQEEGGEEQAEVWEIWHKTENVVVWVNSDIDEVLDIQEPYLDLEGFFPCPKPAYATLQRATLIPVPDFVYYRDQAEEINELTARISSLSESLRMKGFYPGGAKSDISEVIEKLMKDTGNTAYLVPVNNFAALGGKSLKESIIWLPVLEIANVIRELLQLRRQLIEDIYQITGLSDIMRGSTQASETLGAQQLKSQYGSVRIQQKQGEMVRLSRDTLRIVGEVMAENFSKEELFGMAQMQQVPTQEQISQQIQGLLTQVMQQAQNPQVQAQVQQQPELLQQAQQAVQAQIQKLQGQITQDKVMQLYQSDRMRPYVLEIETDSTISPNEDREKERRSEFIVSIGSFIGQALPLLESQPSAAGFVAESLKFVASGFRAGRPLDSAIDEFAELIQSQAKEALEAPKRQEAAEQEAAKVEQAQAQAEQGKLAAEAAKLGMEAEKLKLETMALQQELQNPDGNEVNPLEVKKLELEARRLAFEEGKLIKDTARDNAQREAEVTSKRLDVDMKMAELGIKPSDDDNIDEKLNAIAVLLSETTERLAAMISNSAEVMAAPKEIVRDENGRAVGVRIANGSGAMN